MVRFEWDDNKAGVNLAKHGVSFETAAQVFDDPSHVAWVDERFDYSEERWVVLGVVQGQVLAVAFVWLEGSGDSDGEEIIRLISARKASHKEREFYSRFVGKDPG